MTDSKRSRRSKVFLFGALVALTIAFVVYMAVPAPQQVPTRAPSSHELPTRNHASALERSLSLGDRAPDSEDRLTLRGKVTTPTGDPVPNASVRLLSAPEAQFSAASTTSTRVDGSFAFERQLPGKYLLEAQAEESTSPTVPHALSATSAAVLLVVFPGANLEVRVISSLGGTPIPDAKVRVGLGNRSFGGTTAYREAKTEADGVARFAGLTPIANHQVAAVADGYVGTFINVMAGLNPDRRAWRATVALTPGGGSIEGRVVDRRRRPIGNAKVGWSLGTQRSEMNGLMDPLPTALEGAASTDADGRFRITVEPGTGCLFALAPAHQIGRACNIQTDASHARTGVEIVLGDGGRLRGRVVTPDGVGVLGATVLLTQPGWNHMPMFSHTYRFQTVSANDGRFEFSGVDPILVNVYAYDENRSSRLVTADLRGAEEISDLVVPLEHSAQITGAVVDSRQHPVPFASVEFFITPESRFDAVTYVPHPTYGMTKTNGAVLADAHGKFAITGLPEGLYTLSASRPVATAAPPSFGSAWKHKVSTGESATLTVPGLGSVRGRVVFEEGSPATEFGVSFAVQSATLTGDSFTPPRLVASQDGSFEIGELPARTYALEIRGQGVATLRLPNIAVREDELSDLGTVRVLPGVTQEGLAVTTSQDPAAGAEVTVVRESTSQNSPKLVADAAGRFSIPGLRKGEPLRLRAESSQGSSAWMETVAAEVPIQLVLSLSGVGSLSGVMADMDLPVENRLVVLTPTGRGTPGQELPIAKGTRTQDGGRFRIDEVPPGDYLVWVFRSERQQAGKDRWLRYPQPVSIETAKQRVLVFDVSKESNL